MLKKFSLMALLIAAIFCLTGCGGPEKPQISADKTIKAWTEIQAFGKTDTPSDSGLSAEEINAKAKEIKDSTSKAFTAYHLSNENADKFTDTYIDYMKGIMEIRTKIKKDDSEHPVIEVTMTPIDLAEVQKEASEKESMKLIVQGINEMLSAGQEPANDAEAQDAILTVLDEFYSEMPVKEDRTLDVTCRIAEGSDGKTYWTPEDPMAIANFISGK